MRIAPILIGVALLGLLAWATVAYAAPLYRIERSILPEITSTFYLGSSSPDRAWAGGFFDSLTLGGVTRTTWPSGGGGGSFPFEVDSNYGQVVYSTSTPTLWFKSGFMASSTSYLVNASTSQLSIGTDFITDINGNGLSLSAAGVLTSTLGTTIAPNELVGQASFANNGVLSVNTAGSFFTSGTTTLTASGPLALSQPINVFGASPSVLSIDTSGAWTGTAGSLAANGANCSAGSFPLGVDASGAAETCTDAWTEAENTAAAYAPQSRQLTIAGTAKQIASSAGAQTLAADRTWTLSLPSHVEISSSFVVPSASTTNATTTGTLAIPAAASPNTAGQSDAARLAYDTTSGNLVVGTTTTNTHVVFGSATSTLYAFSVASTSPDFASGGIIDLPSKPLPFVVTGVICHVDSGTSQVINLSDGTNDTNTVTCSTTRTQYALTSNNSFTAYEAIRLEFGAKTGSPDYLVLNFIGYKTSD